MKGAKPNLIEERSPLDHIPAPAWLSEWATAEWDRVMPILSERKILTVADLGSLEAYCIAMGTVREMEAILQEDGRVVKGLTDVLKRHPADGIQADAMTRARLLAAELGLTPVSRSRPAIREDEDDADSLVDH